MGLLTILSEKVAPLIKSTRPALVAGAAVAVVGSGLLVSDSSTHPEPSPQDPQGPLANMEMIAFDYDTIKYPLNLGEDTRHPYYMTFFINAATDSKYLKAKPNTTMASRLKIGADGTVEQSEVQKHQSRELLLGDTGLGFQRKTRRTTTSIRLYVPDTMTMDFQHSYDEPSLSGLPMAKTASVLGALWGMGASALDAGSIQGAMSALGKYKGSASSIAGTLMESFDNKELALSTLGIAVNPQIDVIYKSPGLRSFRFEFLFAPRTPEESSAVKKIVRLFKFHAAPEILDDGSMFGRYFLQPSEFDIEYSMVSSVGKISTCVLEGISVDYAPQGAAFYKDGSPVYTRLMLSFKELEYITKELIDEGY
jgi:hypothetical protein